MNDDSRPPLPEQSRPLAAISDDDLLLRLAAILAQSRRVEADLVAHIGEVDARRLYAREAAPSMFEYCTRVLHLSEQEAYVRITVARCCRFYPLALAMLRDGQLHLSGIARLAPHLGSDNAEALLRRSARRSKRQIEDMLAEMAPRPDARTIVRKLPDRGVETHRSPETQLGPDRVESSVLNGDPASTLVAVPGPAQPPGPGPALDVLAGPRLVEPSLADAFPPKVGPLAPASPPRARIEPLAPARYKVQFTASAELRDKLERLQALMRSSVPDGDLATVIERAVTEKIERLEARRFARVKAPRRSLAEAHTTPTSRHIPAAVRRAVHARDGGRCVYRDGHGRRCPELHDLEFHHRIPYGRGGNHSAEGLCLMCRAHNALMAENDYGRETMERFRRPASTARAGWRDSASTARRHRADS